MFVLSEGIDDVGGINGIDPDDDMFGERVGVKGMAEAFA